LVISLLGIYSCSTTQKLGPAEPTENFISNRNYPGKNNFFEIDKFENVYLVYKNQLTKIDQLNGNSLTYENDRYGEITSIDVTNPQKILVFYQLYDIIITLDNSLAETSIIDLKRFEYTDIDVVAASNDNNIWLYDPISFELRKIDKNGKILAQSFSLNSVYLDQVIPNFLIEHKNMVYMNSPEDGILIFDNLGQYIKILPITSLTDLQIANGNIIYVSSEGPVSYVTAQIDNLPIQGIDAENYNQLRISKTHYYLGYDDGVDKVRR